MTVGATALFFLAALPALATEPRVITVGVEPHADFASLQEAINHIAPDQKEPVVISIAPGSYFGHVVLDKPGVTLRGSGVNTCLTFNLGQSIPGDDLRPLGPEGAATLLITPAAHDARIENLTLENTYGKGMQAQACTVQADRVVFSRCRLLGWQDTLKADAGRHWFTQCYIAGHVDFIYGGAAAVFEDSEIHCRDQGYIAAPATPEGRPGFLFLRCRVTFPYGNPQTFLGRPWKNSPQAIFAHCELGAGVAREGWHEWNIKPPLVRFAEYANTGPGAISTGRVSWGTVSTEPLPETLSKNAFFGDWQPDRL